jgi:hypothetical protein
VSVLLTSKSVQIQWRRDKVRELSVKGNTQRDIAAKLQISLGLVVKDLRHMNEQSGKRIDHYVDVYLPTAYDNAIATLDMITKEMWEMEPKDNRELIQSRALIKECTSKKIEFIASGRVVQRALKFVEKYRGLTEQNTKVLIDAPSDSNVNVNVTNRS